MPLYIWDGKLLKVADALAADPDCCCTSSSSSSEQSSSSSSS